MKFYGRTEEIAALQKHLDLVKETAASRMVVVYGRRRVGKTTLVNEAFRNVDVTEPLHGRGSTTNLIRSPNPNNP